MHMYVQHPLTLFPVAKDEIIVKSGQLHSKISTMDHKEDIVEILLNHGSKSIGYF